MSFLFIRKYNLHCGYQNISKVMMLPDRRFGTVYCGRRGVSRFKHTCPNLNTCYCKFLDKDICLNFVEKLLISYRAVIEMRLHWQYQPINAVWLYNRCLFWESIRHADAQLTNEKPTWCHLLIYFTYYVLNMFRTLIYPSSACPKHVERIISEIK